jgi:hypothetical protein
MERGKWEGIRENKEGGVTMWAKGMIKYEIVRASTRCTVCVVCVLFVSSVSAL